MRYSYERIRNGRQHTGINLHDDQYDRRNAADLEQYGAFNGTIS